LQTTAKILLIILRLQISRSRSTNTSSGIWRWYFNFGIYTRVYPKDSGLAAWSQNSKQNSSLPLDAVVPLFC